MFAMLALEGRQLGNYDVIRRIRVGGMGAVYEGKQRTAFDRRVAIKVILGNYARDRDMRRRFVREARTVARLHHPHILPLIEYGDEQGLLYLVMPFIEGGTLTSYLRRGLPDVNEVAVIYEQLLDAVEYAHDEGLIHRDIKSSNVLLEQRRSGAPYVYLADFGLVRTSRQAEQERAGQPIPLEQVPGTPHYMAPEQTRGIVTTASDIYALGVLLFQLLTGELPYDDPDEVEVIRMQLSAPIPSPCDYDPSIPLELGEVVRIAMAKRVEDRFATVAELRQAFQAALQGQSAPPAFDELNPPVHDAAPFSGRPMALPLLPPEPTAPVPVLEQRRAVPGARPEASPLLLHRKQRITEDVRKPRPRTTEPVKARRRLFTRSFLAAMLVPILLLALLIVPRLLGLNLFPAGVPLLGANPTTTVSVTPQDKILHNTFLLTASPQAPNANVLTRVIPDRSIDKVATASRTTSTTGTATIAAVQARGSMLLVNNSNSIISVPAGVVFTSSSGVQVQTSQPVNVPPRQGGQRGSISVSAVAVIAGAIGNIPANSINTRCCMGLSVSNPAAFSGGEDTREVSAVSQADVNSVAIPLNQQLRQQLLKQVTQQLHPGEVIAGQPAYNATITPDSPVGAQVDRVNVQVTVSVTVIVYNHNDTDHVAAQLLSTQALSDLGNGYRLQDTWAAGLPRVVVSGKNGLLYLSATVYEKWTYTFSPQQLNQWKQYIKGASSIAALAYLNAQPGVAAVQIHLPFGADHLPASINSIEIVLGSS